MVPCGTTGLLFVFSDDARDLVGGQTAVDLLANHGDGGQTAGADATEGVQRELTVGGALANLDIEFAGESVENFLSATHVASRTEADIDRMFALGLHGEEAVERDDAVYARHGDVEFVGNDFLDLGGQIAEFALHLWRTLMTSPGRLPKDLAISLMVLILSSDNLIFAILFEF